MTRNAHNRFSVLRFNRGRRCISDLERSETAVDGDLIYQNETFPTGFDDGGSFVCDGFDGGPFAFYFTKTKHFPLTFALSMLDVRKCRCLHTAQRRLRALQRALGGFSAADSVVRESIGRAESAARNAGSRRAESKEFGQGLARLLTRT